MPNTKSAEKAVRQSKRKNTHNLMWKKKIREARKMLDALLKSPAKDVGALQSKLSAFQKALDKASKEKTLHKNKANRLKSNYAKKVASSSEKKSRKSTTTGSKS